MDLIFKKKSGIDVGKSAATLVRRNLPNSNDPVAIAYGRDVFVAVTQTGTGNRVLTSNDGITWLARTTPANNTWQDIAYGNGVFVAVASSGTGNRIMTSPDGVTWTARAFRDTTDWKCVSFLNGKFFIGGYSSTAVASVASSSDGITWTNGAGSNLSVAHVMGIAYGNGIYFALSRDGAIGLRSTDGNLWTVVVGNLPARGLYQDICFHNGSFFAVNVNDGASMVDYASIVKSQDGVTWAQVEMRTPSDFTKDYRRVLSVNGSLVLIPSELSASIETSITSSESGAAFKKNKIEALQHFGTNFYFGKACFACGHLVVPIFNTGATTYTAKIASVKI